MPDIITPALFATFERRTCVKCGATVVAFPNEKDPVCQNCGRSGKEKVP